MTNSFWWILLATALYGALHSLLAANSAKVLASQRLGASAYQRAYRFFFSVMAVITFLPVLAMVMLLPDAVLYTIPTPWTYLTLAVQAAAVFGIAWTVLQTGALRFIGFEQLLDGAGRARKKPETLVVNGFYRWVRHPLYTFTFLLLWLSPVMSWNFLALNLGLSGYMLIGMIFEERKLFEQFGQDYVDYSARTPRLIPGLRFRK